MPAYLYLVVEALIEAGVHQGLSRDVAHQLVVGTFEGSAALLTSTGETPEELRHQVTSPAARPPPGMRTLESRAVRSAFITPWPPPRIAVDKWVAEGPSSVGTWRPRVFDRGNSPNRPLRACGLSTHRRELDVARAQSN